MLGRHRRRLVSLLEFIRLSKISLAALCAVLLACPAVAQEEAGEAPSLTIGDAWIRALPPTVRNTAAYMTLSNDSGSTQAIVAGRSPVAGRVEVHTTRRVDGLVRMEKLPGLALASGESASLEPGGTHLMLLDLAYTLTPGDEIDLCLVLASGAEVCTTAEVRRDGDGGGHHHHH